MFLVQIEFLLILYCCLGACSLSVVLLMLLCTMKYNPSVTRKSAQLSRFLNSASEEFRQDLKCGKVKMTMKIIKKRIHSQLTEIESSLG